MISRSLPVADNCLFHYFNLLNNILHSRAYQLIWLFSTYLIWISADVTSALLLFCEPDHSNSLLTSHFLPKTLTIYFRISKLLLCLKNDWLNWLCQWHSGKSEPLFSYKVWYIVGFEFVEMAISTNQKPTIYRNLYENTRPGLTRGQCPMLVLKLSVFAEGRS